jgi:transcriptional regulator with XRE-family HTH domain
LDDAATARSVSLRRLAEDAGVSPSALSALRTGRASRPSMETCYRLAAHLKYDVGELLRLAGYSVEERSEENIADPELDVMFHELLELTPEEREPVKEFVRFALARAATRRRKAARKGPRKG